MVKFLFVGVFLTGCASMIQISPIEAVTVCGETGVRTYNKLTRKIECIRYKRRGH